MKRILLDENLDWHWPSSHCAPAATVCGDTEPLMPKLLEILPTLAQGTLTVLE